MKLKNPLGNKLLFRTSIICGIIPLIVGLAIFFTWWAARAFYAEDLFMLDVFGTLWILASFCIAVIGIVIAFYVLINNLSTHLKPSLITVFCIAINILVQLYVWEAQFNIRQRSYVMFYNDTHSDITVLSVKGNNFEKEFGSVVAGDAIVGHYTPHYVYGDDRAYLTDSLSLCIKDRDTLRIIPFPFDIQQGCGRIHINADYTLRKEEN